MNGSAVGSIFGLVANGFLYDHFGYRKTMVGALSLMTEQFSSLSSHLTSKFCSSDKSPQASPGECTQSSARFESFSILIPPRFQTLAISYASEVCPTVLRGYLTTYANICWV
jgi:MFS transporter, SP family, general alpha glucoside:H+ symporter